MLESGGKKNNQKKHRFVFLKYLAFHAEQKKKNL